MKGKLDGSRKQIRNEGTIAVYTVDSQDDPGFLCLQVKLPKDHRVQEEALCEVATWIEKRFILMGQNQNHI